MNRLFWWRHVPGLGEGQHLHRGEARDAGPGILAITCRARRRSGPAPRALACRIASPSRDWLFCCTWKCQAILLNRLHAALYFFFSVSKGAATIKYSLRPKINVFLDFKICLTKNIKFWLTYHKRQTSFRKILTKDNYSIHPKINVILGSSTQTNARRKIIKIPFVFCGKWMKC
jgi:hypothetical protein